MSLKTHDGRRHAVILIVEPGNLDRLREGHPIKVNLNELVPAIVNIDLVIDFTPDLPFIQAAIEKRGTQIDGPALYELLAEAKKRPEAKR